MLITFTSRAALSHKEEIFIIRSMFFQEYQPKAKFIQYSKKLKNLCYVKFSTPPPMHLVATPLSLL